MPSEDSPLYCACGTRLARDNRTGRCGRCRQEQRLRLQTPPPLPAAFWATNEFRAAFAARHIGRVIKVYRHHPLHGARPLAQEVVAGWMGQTQAQLSRMENGPALRDLDRLIAWATLLDMPQELLWFALPRRTSSSERPRSDAGRDVRASGPSPDIDLHFMRSLRSADRRVGGGHLYATVTAYLAEGANLPTPGQASDATSTRLLAAAASLNEMAGWMAHDAGAVSPARKHLSAALVLARNSGDQQLAAQACASLSHFACHHGNASDAVSHARDGLKHLRSAPPHGRLEARLLAMKARSFAIGGRALESANALAEAEVALHRGSAAASEWLSPFDATSFAIEAARCFLRIGDLSEAHRRLQDVLAARTPDRVRSRAFAQLMLVTTLLGKGQVGEACGVAHQVLEQTAGLGSAVIVDQLRHVAVLFKSHATMCAKVSPLLDRLHETVSERAWIGAVGSLRAGAIGTGSFHGR